MEFPYLEYELQDGFVQNWLVAGPYVEPLSDDDPGDRLGLIRRRHNPIAEIHSPPAELGSFQIGEQKLKWRYHRCLDDHLVDLSSFYHLRGHLRAWAYCRLSLPDDQNVTLELFTNAPADVWLNMEHVHRQEHFGWQGVTFKLALQAGDNEILVRLENLAERDTPLMLALRADDLPPDARVRIPTRTEYAARRQLLEHIFEQAYVERRIVRKGNKIILRWPDDLDARCHYWLCIQDHLERTYVEALPEAEPSAWVDIGHPARLWENTYYVALLPRPEEYYERDIRYRRAIPVHVVDNEYSDAPYGDYEERRREALEDAARRDLGLYSEIARLALGRHDQVRKDAIRDALAGINLRRDCSDFDLVGILGMLYRYPDSPALDDELKQEIEECVLNFKYWHDEPGRDAMCYATENHSILFHTCEILAGQLYPDRRFTNIDRDGRWHRQKGERLALEWLRKRGRTGFTEWDSNCYFEEDLLALSHLAELAQDEQVREMAAVVMDKMFLTIALNSFKGAFGSTHGRTYVPHIQSARLESTSGISRLMWGMGLFNRHIRGTVALAGSKYELPFIIADIAADLPEEMWNREQHPGVSKVTYKTPDYMLCSAQDYNPGEKGYQQHIWQATLSADAVVFVTHPPSMSESNSRRPNFWAGNAVLPRVAQWKDALIAIHKLPADDWMGFTHAYFPTPAFDEYRLREGWAFARWRRAYLAITAARGIELIKRGPAAYYELRSYGTENVWICFLGNTPRDGSFADFQRKVLSLGVDLQGLTARCETPHGDELAFGWKGPFTVNGREQPLSGFKHYENPYCTADFPTEVIEVRYDDYLLRLHFE